jgi:hypothetical protein
MVLAGFSDFTNAIHRITLPNLLKLYSTLMNTDSNGYWNLIGETREEQLTLFVKAAFMKYNGSTGFREAGERWTKSGNTAPFRQMKGSSGCPAKATFRDILVSTMAVHPYVQGDSKSADVDKFWSPSENEVKQMILE